MKTYLILLGLILSIDCFSNEINDWDNESKNSTVFKSFAGSVDLHKDGLVLKHVKNYYFYNNHIIGEANSRFFVLNEITSEITFYESDKKWHKAIIESGLKT